VVTGLVLDFQQLDRVCGPNRCPVWSWSGHVVTVPHLGVGRGPFAVSSHFGGFYNHFGLRMVM